MRRFVGRPSAAFLLATALLLLAVTFGYWRGAGTGPQVQVPIFYDSHYIFARAWTQSQSAPGVPPPAPLALYGPNRVTQTFVAGHDQIRLLRVRLDGPPGTEVSFTVDDGDLMLDGTLPLDGAGWYAIRLPQPLDGRDRRLTLTLSAPAATRVAPVLVDTVGGDRLGSALRLNEYYRPGNLVLHVYAQGAPGGWWLDAIGEQLLPEIFRLRLQQYKPVKGSTVTVLLATMLVFTAATLWVGLPDRFRSRRAAWWWGAGAIGFLLVWQGATGRLLLPGVAPAGVAPAVTTRSAAAGPTLAPPAGIERVAFDLTQQLWTGDRLPDAYLIATETVGGAPAIRIPPGGAVVFPLQLPFDATLSGAVRPADGVDAGDVRLLWEDVELFGADAARETQPMAVDLGAFGGATGALRFEVSADATGDWLWLRPQIATGAGWLSADLPDDLTPLNATFDGQVILHGYTVHDGRLTLYWEALAPNAPNATVFVHLVGDAGLLAQIDRAPVAGTYPVSVWLPGLIVADAYDIAPLLAAEGAGGAVLVAGLYDGATLARWPAVSADGAPYPDDAIPLARPTD